MLFNSFDFFLFFPAVTIMYYLLPHKFRWFLLLAASCFFYMSFIPRYIIILGLTILVDYYAAIKISESSGKVRKYYLVGSIIVTCIILFIFKYFNFFNSNISALSALLHWNYPIKYLRIILPIGLSFHTFQSLSYVIEVYRGNQKPEKNFGIYSLYVMFYPQLVAGPIERPQNLLHQFHEKHTFEYDNIRKGLILMLWGFFKKLVIADRLSVYVNIVYSNPGHYYGWPILLSMFFFAFQIYCDFSGYSDIAIGAARVMGFRLMYNFNYPFCAKSISEFWRRWHISLTTWFNDYIYTPITINKRGWGVVGLIYAVFITYFISGVWHGAGWTFFIFGVLHGLAVIYEILTRKIRKKISRKIPAPVYNTLSIIFMFSYACFTWIFFRAPDLNTVGKIFYNLTRYSSVSEIKLPGMFISELLVPIAAILLLLTIEYIARKKQMVVENYILSRPVYARWSTYVLLTVFIGIFGYFGNVEFIYFQF